MPKSDKELEARDAGRDIGNEILEAIREMKAGKVGAAHQVEVPEAAEARQRSGLSQAQFAQLLGVSMRTLQDWEQGRRRPSGAARSLLKIALKHPEILRELAA